MLSHIIKATSVVILAVLITIGALLAVGYFMGAERIECNALWCEFEKSYTDIDCKMNGEPINCSEINLGEYENHLYRGG